MSILCCVFFIQRLSAYPHASLARPPCETNPHACLLNEFIQFLDHYVTVKHILQKGMCFPGAPQPGLADAFRIVYGHIVVGAHDVISI